MRVEPYLSFEGQCEAALEFYKKALGAEVTMLMRFKDSPDQTMMTPGTGDKIMHSTLRIGGSTLMASDGRCEGKTSFQGISLAVAAKDVAEAEQVFNALAEGGQVQMPLIETFWSPRFGMVADRFGVTWMINVMP